MSYSILSYLLEKCSTNTYIHHWNHNGLCFPINVRDFYYTCIDILCSRCMTCFIINNYIIYCIHLQYCLLFDCFFHQIFLLWDKNRTLVVYVKVGGNQSAKGWIMYGMDSKLKLGDQLKNFRTISKIGGFITWIAS